MAYFSGQGIVEAAVVANGVPGVFRDVGNVAAFEFPLSYDVAEHYESRSGQRALDSRITRQKKPALNATFEAWSKENLALFMQGASSTQPVTPVTSEVIAATLPAVGDILRIAAANISAITIKDSTGSPKTLTLNTNYSLDASYGEITILDITTGGAYVAPIKADYTPGVATNINMMTQAELEMWIRFKGVNTADSNRKVLVEFYRARIPTAKLMTMISDDPATKFELDIAVLADAAKANDTYLGQFGRIVLLP
jgi:hypothetical protein